MFVNTSRLWSRLWFTFMLRLMFAYFGTGPGLRLISVYYFLEVICRRQTSQGQLYRTQNDLCTKLMADAFLKLYASLMLENTGFLLHCRRLVLIIQPCLIFNTPRMTSLLTLPFSPWTLHNSLSEQGENTDKPFWPLVFSRSKITPEIKTSI